MAMAPNRYKEKLWGLTELSEIIIENTSSIINTGVINNAFMMPNLLISLPVRIVFTNKATTRTVAKKKAMNCANAMSLCIASFTFA
jgi:hypothetical protein